MEQKPGTSEKLYRLVQSRLKQVGETMPCSPAALQVYAGGGRGELDYSELIDLENEALVEACYAIAFNASPPEEYVQMWRSRAKELEKDPFHREFMNWFVNLREFRAKDVRLKNCICLEKRKNGPSWREAVRERLYRVGKPLYRKLPAGVRLKLKKLLRRFWH